MGFQRDFSGIEWDDMPMIYWFIDWDIYWDYESKISWRTPCSKHQWTTYLQTFQSIYIYIYRYNLEVIQCLFPISELDCRRSHGKSIANLASLALTNRFVGLSWFVWKSCTLNPLDSHHLPRHYEGVPPRPKREGDFSRPRRRPLDIALGYTPGSIFFRRRVNCSPGSELFTSQKDDDGQGTDKCELYKPL